MPPSNSVIKAETEAGLGGCLYTGPTRIRLRSNGTMDVRSPFSKQTNNSCPTNGNGALPSNGVVYVQNVPSVSSDPELHERLPVQRERAVAPARASRSATTSTRTAAATGTCSWRGLSTGSSRSPPRTTSIVTWDTTYEDGVAGDDLLGLVANNYVEMYHPVELHEQRLGLQPELRAAERGAVQRRGEQDVAQHDGDAARRDPVGEPLVLGAAVQRPVRR
ncbi:MAG: hypothetical protein KatS3mg010_0629 [Acidimicrobiia bacterium]|nr:MAG: hypothetical protein KatS3mg010_0629 [Acidimicrobiia bacterium]